MKYQKSLISLSILALVSLTSPALGASSVLSPTLEAGTATTDGASYIEKMYQRADSYEDYLFEFEMTAYRNGKVVETGRFFYKKPHMIRLEETGKFRKGSVAILGKNGKVKAKAGGGLGFFVVDLAPDSGLLRSVNGYPMQDSDLASLARALKTFLKEGKTSRVTQDPLVFGDSEGKVHVLEVFHDGAMKNIYKRVAVDPQSHLPVEWWDYENGKLVSHSRWKSFKGNLGLSEEVFTIKGATKQL